MKNKPASIGIIILFLFFNITSCEKEKPIDEAIIGKWEVASMNQITFENNVKKAEVIIYFEEGEMAYQFIEGGSGIFFDADDDYLFSWTLTGNELTISDLYAENLMVNASVDGDVLMWSYKENDSQTPTKSYEFIMMAKRIN